MKVLLIPSATLISREMRVQMGNIPSCLFPLENATMLERICRSYADFVDQVYVIAGEEKEKIRDYITIKKMRLEIINIDEIKDLGYTIWYGIKFILGRDRTVKQIYINFGDTLITNQLSTVSKDTIYYSNETISPEWTFFDHRDGKIYDIIDKGQSVKTDKKTGNVFSGVFMIAHPREFFKELFEALICVSPQLDTFYGAIANYSRKHSFDFIPAEGWIDVGHGDRYERAKIMVATRSFNSVKIDADRGTLTKSSTNTDKFIDEIKWYLKLPDQLQYLSPRIYHYSLNWDSPYVTMEYYGYNTLHEMLVYGNASELQWKTIFRRLLFILEDMSSFQLKGNDSARAEAMEDIYINKTIARLECLRTDNLFSNFFLNDLFINNKHYPSLDEYVRRLPELLRERLLKKIPAFCIIHGDLCFSNILSEKYYGFLRLVDPRGRFGKYDIYGDQRYELAKLMHSMDGQYDFIIEDMFSIQVNGNWIDFEITTNKEVVYDYFCDIFRGQLSEYRDLKLIEGLLFLSMIPLHNDFPNRQLAMLATGLRLLEEAM